MRKRIAQKMKKNNNYWIKNVKTITVNVPPKTMTKSPEEIARILLRHNKFEGAPDSIIKFIQFHINRAGKNMLKQRVKELKRAQEIIQEKSKKK